MIFSYDLEKKVLSGLLQHQHKWEEVSSSPENQGYNPEKFEENAK